MSLLKLIENLDNSTKTLLLGDETTKILKYTFTNSEHEAVDSKIIDLAISIQLGASLISKRENRKLLIEFCRPNILKQLGYEDNYEKAILEYSNNFDKFFQDFQIEDEYRIPEVIDNRINTECVIPKYGECNGIMPFPHDYQKRLKDKIIATVVNKVQPIILTIMPTGSGKTVLAMEVITDMFRFYEPIKNKKINIGWVVKSKELCEQSLQSFQRIWKQKGDHPVFCERYFGKFSKLESINQSKITFASFDLISSRINNPEVQHFLESVDLLVIDEVHFSEAETYSEIIYNYKKLKENYKILGLTATPYRADNDEFNSFKNNFNVTFQITDNNENEVSSPIQYLIEREYLSSVKYHILSNSEGNVSKNEYYKTLHNAVLFECSEIIRKNENTIIFAQSKSHAIALSIFLKKNNIKNGLIVGETPDPIRKELLKEFENKNNDLNIIVNHQILSTGIDVPGMNSIMILSEINSPTLALQILGRAMRGIKNGGNKENTIYLTKENYNKLSEYKLLESLVLN